MRIKKVSSPAISLRNMDLERVPFFLCFRLSFFLSLNVSCSFVETTIHAFTSTHIAAYLSLVPTSSDAVLSFGTQDAMIMSTPGPSSSSAFSSPPHPSTLTQSFPHPAQTQSSAQDQGQGSDTSRKWISILTSRNGDVPRMLARDMYTKSWSAFDRLVAIVPPGGSIGYVLT